MHGWIHELNSVLPREAERELMLRAADTLEQITGIRPIGLRTPSWDFSPSTLAIAKELGIEYDSSPDGRRGLLRIVARWRTHEHRRASRRVDSRRCGVFYDEPPPIAQTLHAAVGTCSRSSAVNLTQHTPRAAFSS